jgi:hypothetical protein
MAKSPSLFQVASPKVHLLLFKLNLRHCDVASGYDSFLRFSQALQLELFAVPLGAGDLRYCQCD